MEDVVIKVSKEHYESADDMKKFIKYVAAEGKNAGKEKLLKCRGRGVSSKASKAVGQMIAVQKVFRKADKRRMYQLIVSFEGNMRDADVIQQAADAIADMLFEEYQVFTGYIFQRITGISTMLSMRSVTKQGKNGIRAKGSLRR